MSENQKGRYVSPYSPEEVGTGMTPLGVSSRDLYRLEEAEQRRVAESESWQLAREVNTYETNEDRDSRSGLEALGFLNIHVVDDLFYEAVPPAGWTRSTEGYWTKICDENGFERISMFYKGAVYDRRAFLSFSRG